MIECLVFDLDDTLYPEGQYVIPRLESVAGHLQQHFGYSYDFRGELIRGYKANITGNLFNVVLSKAGINVDKQYIDKLVKIYRSGHLDLTCYPDVIPALEYWCERLYLGLVTDGNPNSQRSKIDALDISGFFHEIIITAELSPKAVKPSPKPFKILQDKLGLKGNAMYVGDNPELDVPGCRKLGWATARIIRPDARFAHRSASYFCQPDYTIKILSELKSLTALQGYV